MNSSAPTTPADKFEDDWQAGYDEDIPEALECWTLHDFLDIIGGQLQ
jgi:hypothetical protein